MGLTLQVEDRPTIDEGDVLLVTPDVGTPYRERVIGIVDEAQLRVRLSDPGKGFPHPVEPRTRALDREELEDWYVIGDLVINPGPRPGRYARP